MATVYQKRDSRVWYGQWSVFDAETGKWKRRQKSTRETDEVRAQQIVDEWQRNADAVAAMVGATRRGMSQEAGRGMPKMSDREREILNAVLTRDPSRDPRRKAGLWHEFAQETIARRANEATRRQYEGCVTRWEEFCASRGQAILYVEDGNIEMAEEWVDSLVNSGLGAKRVNFYITVVSMIYERARKRGLVMKNPFADVGRIPIVPTRDNLSSVPFSEEQVQRLLLAPYKFAAGAGARYPSWHPGMAEEWEVLIALTAVMGQRRVDAVSLRWGNVDREQWNITYLPRKTAKRGRYISFPLWLWEDVAARLAQWASVSERTGKEDAVFPLIYRAAQNKLDWVTIMFRQIVETAGISNELQREGWGDGVNKRMYSFHSLRHTAITRAAAKGVPAEIRKELFGHASEDMNRVYTHWDADTLRELLTRHVTK